MSSRGARPVPRVLVTRAAEDAGALSLVLGNAGLQPVEVPALARLWDLDAVASLAERAADADCLVVTSASVADVVAAAAPHAWREARVAAVGPGTARRLQDLGWSVAVVPERSTAADLVVALGDLAGQQVAWPRAELADPRTAEALRAAGAEVDEAIAYRNVQPSDFAARLADALPVDCTTVLSGSAARRLAAQVPSDQRWRLGRVVVIGPTTLGVAESVGLEVHGMARPHTLSGVAEAVERLFRRFR